VVVKPANSLLAMDAGLQGAHLCPYQTRSLFQWLGGLPIPSTWFAYILQATVIVQTAKVLGPPKELGLVALFLALKLHLGDSAPSRQETMSLDQGIRLSHGRFITLERKVVLSATSFFCNASKVREICFSFVRVQASYTSSKMGVYSTKLLARLEDCEQRKMVGSLLQKNGRLRIGTACSGSDAPVMVVKSLVSLFQTHIAANPSIYGSIPLAVDFVFSCEANQGSAWAATEMRPQYAFVDVGHLGQTFAWDVEQQCDARVPEVDVFILGFSCKCLISKDGRVFVSYCMLL